MNRRQCGLRSAEVRRESDDNLRRELEDHCSELLALFNLHKHHVPLYPVGQSRLEWFLAYADSRSEGEIWDAMQAQADRETAALVAAFERIT